ncbi:regulator of chromosome condensation 1/beta-lactamase-inhibitor protein II, partial [Aspergillus tetrazonus]
MGNGTPAQYKQPTKNTQLPDVVQVAAGGEHCIALTHDNKIYTWGDNSHGQLGRLTSSTTAQMPGEVDFSEVNLPDYTIFAQVVATQSACFVLTMFGDVYGWGTFSEVYEDENGEQHCEPLGFRHQGKCQRTPYHIQELQDVKRLAAGSDHVLAQISILIGGNRASSSAPKMKGPRVRKRKDTITAGGSSIGGATKVRDVVRSWGAYKRGQLGRTAANIANCLNPLLCDFSGNSSRVLKNPDNVSSIGSGKFHSFVIRESGDFLAWGYNKFAQAAFVPPAASVLRRDSKVDKPSTVAGLRGQRVHCSTGGVDFSVALTADGRCLSWGSFQNGVRSIPDTAMPDEPDFNKVAGPDDGTQIPAIMKVPTFVPGINAHDKRIQTVSAGWTHTIAVTNGGKALGWGSNDHYEIHPDETKHPINDPVEIPMEGLRVVEAAAGRFFTILLVQS